MNSLHHCHNCCTLRHQVEQQQKDMVELRQENKLLKEKINELVLENHKTQTTPKYKPRHTDYDDMSSPELEELHDTVQIIRDAAYARQLASTPEPLTVSEQLKRTKQIVQDSILARKLSKCDV